MTVTSFARAVKVIERGGLPNVAIPHEMIGLYI